MDAIIRGTVKKGAFIPADPTAFRLVFAKLEGKAVEVVVRKKKKHRSGAQNAYYWGIVIDIISGATGFTPQEAHDAMRFKFLIATTFNSIDIKRIKSTSELTTVEFLDYIALIQQWASEFLDCYIPEPNEGEI